MQLAAAEAKSGHALLSRTISSLLKDNEENTHRFLTPLNSDLSEFVLESSDSFRLNNLIVSETVKGRIERILKEYLQRDVLYKNGLHNRSKILLTGPSGTGKTMTASILANELQLPLYIVRLEKVITKYMGESSLKLGKVFELISKVRGVYLFDEFDAIGSQRRNENEVGEMRRILNTFLQLLERENSESLIIAATNNPDVLDVALRRRFDDVIGYGLPDDPQIRRLVVARINGFMNKSIDTEKALSLLRGRSHAEICLICADAVKEAILSDKPLTQEMLEEAIKQRPSSIDNTLVNG
jgi:SpoVK/Ycf46/Vps4 family AAA+-type ATPase